MTIIRELHLYLTKVTFILKHSVKLRRYMYLVMWLHVVERHVCYMPFNVRVSLELSTKLVISAFVGV